jgi:hypothetical protein
VELAWSWGQNLLASTTLLLGIALLVAALLVRIGPTPGPRPPVEGATAGSDEHGVLPESPLPAKDGGGDVALVDRRHP